MLNDLIAESLSVIATVESPDDAEFQSALLLSYNVCMEAADRDEVHSDKWTFAGLAIHDSYDRLTRELPDDLVAVGGPVPGALEPDEARAPAADLVAGLATLAATAATSESHSPWRRLVWSSVATHLDRALQELR
ncbi:hypothetical protein GA0070616_0052 [Micromonospora nigra]|uniref:Uncharacterized protein n=1 Tax=Micromonospora nigra TaxID=145857 RepID=A0A1C6R7A1_9ACTN|nr:hypothetical protein [Micromonospora nigra]SCL12884.1 hypothetical protein GA0070616_0052 [Micromonospora nigra]